MRDGWLRIPEGLPMLWNVYDYSVCKPGVCTAPLLSSIKWAEDADVLVPPFGPHYKPYWVPWEDKSDTAFFRGTNYCAPHPLNGTADKHGANCSRAVLSDLSRQRPDLLNCSLLGQGVGRVPHAEFANFKYLLALDGYTASSRLGSLLPINSAVLKQESQWLEWYYAALQPCGHYLPFWRQSEDDVLSLLRTLRGAPANEALARSLAANSYTFAAAVLGDAGVYRFWQRVIDRYVQLYRGPANASAAKAAKAWAERVGRKASAHGAVVEAQCWRDGGQACWYVGRDAGRAIVQEEREKRDMAAAESAAADGGAGGASTSDKGRKRGKKGKNAAIAADG
ncbi:hypothetical protein COHA_001530 [Chlorella ohadii]|uniref:Glycosyl transferase CAP10 domain-containing protein n=1 Tax=Chlorella ohadii TaxID=2649997 RepID=A0AAD5DV20_9CHLO|nr:hypothetical protein COHA_001530 [Chlorella ohadii]